MLRLLFMLPLVYRTQLKTSKETTYNQNFSRKKGTFQLLGEVPSLLLQFDDDHFWSIVHTERKRRISDSTTDYHSLIWQVGLKMHT